jgi:hypothetical protein
MISGLGESADRIAGSSSRKRQENQMASKITTSLIGRNVLIGDNTEQRTAKVLAARQQESGASVPGKYMPLEKYAKHGRKVGKIVSAYIDGGSPVYTVECDGDLMDLVADHFEVMSSGD